MEWLKAVFIVFGFAIFGSLIAGDPNVGPYSKLTMPDFSPPLWGWLIVAGLYYLMMVIILRRLWTDKGRAFFAIVLVLTSNELWNVFLFQMGRADLAFLTLIPFSILVIFAAYFCNQTDKTSGRLMILYCAWLVFDLFWAGALMGLNPVT